MVFLSGIYLFYLYDTFSIYQPNEMSIRPVGNRWRCGSKPAVLRQKEVRHAEPASCGVRDFRGMEMPATAAWHDWCAGAAPVDSGECGHRFGRGAPVGVVACVEWATASIFPDRQTGVDRGRGEKNGC